MEEDSRKIEIGVCPYCGSTKGVQRAGKKGYRYNTVQKWHCNNCGKNWQEEYKYGKHGWEKKDEVMRNGNV